MITLFRGKYPALMSLRAVAVAGPLLMMAACAASVPPAPPPAPPVADTVQDRFFTTSDGVRLHYLEAGGGTTIVFVPGWTMPGWIFGPQIAQFRNTNRVIAFDPRGQGESEVPAAGYEPHRRGQDITELLAHLHAGKVVLVGWSLGVLDSLAAIADHGDAEIAALVLIDNSVGESPAPPPRKPPPRYHGRLYPRAMSMRSFVDGMFATHQPEDYLRRLTAAALRMPAADAQKLLAYPVPRSFWREAVYATSKPILYVVRPSLEGQAANLQKNHADTETVVLPHVGHALFVDDPERFNTLLRGFLQQHGL